MALRPDALNLISICTGGGGLDLGVELAIPNTRSVCMVEREAFGCAQLVSAMQQGLMAQAPVWSDARTFNGRAWRGAVDGLIGGIPCQPHSLAGKRLEREDPRDLWSTARRIIVQSGAWFVLIENVAGMLSSGGAERVYGDLGRLGFAREVGLFTASEVGASHQRERTFILGVADTDHPRSQGRRDGGRSIRWENQERHAGLGSGELVHAKSVGWGEGRTEPVVQSGRHSSPSAGGAVVDASSIGRATRGGHGAAGYWPAEFQSANPDQPVDDASIARSGRVSVLPGRQVKAGFDPDWASLFPPGPSDLFRWGDLLASSPELEPAFRRVADGLASRLDTARVDRLRMLGNGVVPLQAAYAVRTLATRLASRGSAGAARLVRMMEMTQ